MALLNAVALSTSPFASLSPLRSNSKGNLQLMRVSVPRLSAKPLSRASPIKCHQHDKTIKIESIDREVRRSDFPADFLFGASSSALQTEGIDKGIRGPSIWDWMLTMKGCTNDAIDSYTKFTDDVQMLKGMSANCYRFSISWSRILPTGTLAGGINDDGIRFYNDFINEMIRNGITPIVTLYHFDLPKALMVDYHGFLDKRIVDDFKEFANICFENFGDRVKLWTTFNEPQVITGKGVYADESFTDDKTKMPYICAHNIILAHATVAKLYRETYKASQGGEIGFPTCAQWFLPLTDTPADRDAAKRANDFFIGWYLEPLITGDYPFSMKAILKGRLPTFSDEEKEMVKGSFDFITINYYTSRYAQAVPYSADDVPVNYDMDQYLNRLANDVNGIPIGPRAPGEQEANQCPELLKDVLLDLKNHYGNPKTYISENGVMDPLRGEDLPPLPLYKQLDDTHRIGYLKAHLKSVSEAIREGANVKGYCMWCLNDAMELDSGLTVRMGLNYIDHTNNFQRIPKKSANWFYYFLTTP